MTSQNLPQPQETQKQHLKREEDASPAAAAFSQVSGILGGFSVTIVVLALSPSVISNNLSKDFIVGIVLLSAAIYIYSSGIFATAISFDNGAVKYLVFRRALKFFHLANLFLSLGILLLTFQFQLRIAGITSTIIALSAFRIAIIDIFRKV
jgi:hypothetical protein